MARLVLLDTDANYSPAERAVYRAWLQNAALALGRGRELPAHGHGRDQHAVRPGRQAFHVEHDSPGRCMGTRPWDGGMGGTQAIQ